jgi:preprotein translocase subunit SecD
MPLLVRSDVESVNSSIDKSTQTVVTGIKFKPEAIALWAEATRRNLNKHIAIVVDNQVLYSPLVRNVIEGGVCEITGNLSQKETNYFIALVNNEPLPVSFTILK